MLIHTNLRYLQKSHNNVEPKHRLSAHHQPVESEHPWPMSFEMPTPDRAILAEHGGLCIGCAMWTASIYNSSYDIMYFRKYAAKICEHMLELSSNHLVIWLPSCLFFWVAMDAMGKILQPSQPAQVHEENASPWWNLDDHQLYVNDLQGGALLRQ